MFVACRCNDVTPVPKKESLIEFWNKAPLQIQKAVQHTLFPHGLAYGFEKGFGTIELNESYLLLQKIASEDASDSIVVAASGLEPLTPGL